MSWLYVLSIRVLSALMILIGPAHSLTFPPLCPQPRTLLRPSMLPTKQPPFPQLSRGCVPRLLPLLGPYPGPQAWADFRVRAARHTDSAWHQRPLLLSCLQPCLVVLSLRKPMALTLLGKYLILGFHSNSCISACREVLS